MFSGDISGKVVLITGALGGIGQATTKVCQAAGITVVTTDKIGASVQKCNEINYFECLAEVETRVATLVDFVAGRYGKIDVLFNNCGVGANLDYQEGRAVVCQTVLDMQDEDFDRVMAINFKSACWFAKYVVPHMPKSDSSCIISSSSIWSKGKLHYALSYAASKAALSVAAMNWAYQFAPIRSVSLVIGGIDTPMLRANPEGAKEVSEQTLLKRAGTPEEVAEAVLFAIRCRYLTATEIVIDGGSYNR